ncbi:MAG TPA: FGGY-family carbohydrate kinase, partial [Gammaproteobacteria bacterium]|nr:FGGY-family carbohydrate kinase [Gammaproteobacteria bacterium]
IKWLRDVLKFVKTAAETERLATQVEDTNGVYLVPGFTGLGAPYWDPFARAAILGLTRDSSIAHISRAALEAVCYQTRDLLDAMKVDSRTSLEILRVDGGMVANNWLLQFLADILKVEVERPACYETSALGAAYLAGLKVGVYQSLDDIASLWRANARFTPKMPDDQSENLYEGWKNAVARVLTKTPE